MYNDVVDEQSTTPDSNDEQERESISYYYYAGLLGNVSTASLRSGSTDSHNNNENTVRTAASLKKDLTVLSLGQLRTILDSLIDSADPDTMAKVSSLIGNEVDRLRTEKKHSSHWNDKFQYALEHKSNKELSHLGDDFHFTANLYSQVLIAERDLPDWKKTILPVNIGGFAGGTKYICHGIVFKFASDDRKIYGNQRYAAKAVSAELRHCSAIRESSGSRLAVPLGVSIDWLGHRLSATSLLPLRGRASLVHGSDDAGKHIYFGDDDEDCLQVVNALSKSLGLAPHRVRGGARYISGPVDMEIHRTDDGRLYALDCHRLFPCEAPLPELRPATHVWPKCGHLVRLLRPEFVQHYAHMKSIYFSSDAYSKFAHATIQQEDDKKVEIATRYLLTELIPLFARRLDETWLERSGTRRRRMGTSSRTRPTTTNESGRNNANDANDANDANEANEADDANNAEEDYYSTEEDRKERAMSYILNTLSNDCHAVGINIRLLG